MRTMNEAIDVFKTLEDAEKAFDKIESGHLLLAEGVKLFYVDKNKQAVKHWPRHYKIYKEK
jgi:hypothetical protein